MRLLFVHQNMPGQYRELAAWLAAAGGHQIVFITQRADGLRLEGIETRIYSPHHRPASGAYGLSRVWEEAVGAGYGVALEARRLAAEGFVPDLVLGHTGWGELLFLKQVWPEVPVLGFFEYFYRAAGGLVGFDPAQPVKPDQPFLLEARNAVPYASLHAVDLGQVPTRWQQETFPQGFQDKLYRCHDGIRTDLLRPDPEVSLGLQRLGRPLTRQDEVVTFLARHLEQARGFHIFMRALPRILAARPAARVLVVGDDKTYYGRPEEESLRARLSAELADELDWSRVHFLGRVPYSSFCQVVQLSRCHIYLTMPFVLSWSLLEAMSMQATVVSSDVAPVREAIRHGETGLLVDFFDHEALAAQVIAVLEDPAGHAHLGPAARAHVVEHYDFLTRCLPGHLARMNSLLPADRQFVLPPVPPAAPAAGGPAAD